MPRKLAPPPPRCTALVVRKEEPEQCGKILTPRGQCPAERFHTTTKEK
jgi:hypothetical protein